MNAADLPVFVPSPQAVTQAAERLWASVTKGPAEGRSWEDEPPHMRIYYTQRATDMLSGAGQRLVADAAAHLAENAEPYGLPSMQESDTQDTLRRVTEGLRVSLDLADL